MAWSAIAFTLLAPLLTAASGATRSAAYPIEPVPLRDLVEQADVIATVRVRVAESPAPPDEWGGETVELVFDQLLKGDPGRATIRHLNEVGFACPTPVSFIPGNRALVFLERDMSEPTRRSLDGFFILGRAYGAKTLKQSDLELYVERAKEEFAILAMPQGPERRAAQVEWLVRCAEQPATCWEGAYDLAPQGDPDARYFDERKNSFADALTLEQRQRLYAAFLQVDPGDRGAHCLEHLLDADRDPRLLAWLVARLRSAEEPEKDERSFQTRRLVQQIARRDPRPEIAVIAKALEETIFLPREKWDVKRLAAEHRRLVTELLALFPQ